MLRLTAEFGMGSGRTTALWPPKKFIKERAFSEIYTQGSGHGFNFVEFEIAVPLFREKSDQAARPISISPLNGLLRLHA
jgi:hypothetical protein